MININIKASQNTPYVKIDPDEGVVVIKGNSSPENALKFYKPIIRMIQDLYLNASEPIVINLAFKYFNTASSKCLFDLFRILKNADGPERKAVINWSYEKNSDEMRETGEDYSDLLDMHFNYVELNEIKPPGIIAA